MELDEFSRQLQSNGPYAFPFTARCGDKGEVQVSGMTLRAYAAIHILAGMDKNWSAEWAARCAIERAEALITALGPGSTALTP